jgi:hypothetical protein
MPRQMTHLNPYQSPTLPAEEISPAKVPAAQTAIALLLLFASTAAALTYTYVDEVVLVTKAGAWPMLIVTGLVAIVAAWTTRHVLLAPACCCVATIAGDLLAAKVSGVAYAQFHLCIPLAFAFSCPALLVAFLFRKRP